MNRILRGLVYVLLAATAWGADKKEDELASRFDYVGILTHSRNPRWNTTRDGKLSPIDPKKVPKGRILVGIIIDKNDDFFPLKGRVHEEGLLIDNEWDVAMRKVTDTIWVGWDEGSDVVKISILRRGAGYRRMK